VHSLDFFGGFTKIVVVWADHRHGLTPPAAAGAGAGAGAVALDWPMAERPGSNRARGADAIKLLYVACF
jgi:hypothetical protein